MNYLSTLTVCACCTLLTPAALAAGPEHGHGQQAHTQKASAEPINKTCPIGQEPVEDDGGRTVYKGNTIGFCCPGCIGKFNNWDEAKKDEFVAMAMAGNEASEHAKKMKKKGKVSKVPNSGPYLLSTCPISGEKLGGMGEPIVKVYDGREVKFCCQMCVPRFEKDLDASFAKLDQQIIESQMPFYPTTQCVVSDQPLTGEDGMDEPVDFLYNGRLIRLCCKMCRSDFKKNPQRFIKELDKAVIAEQSKDYPLETCPISGGKLGSMGKPVEIVYAGRLVKFCCKMCIPKFEKNPMETIEKIDAAWMAKHDG